MISVLGAFGFLVWQYQDVSDSQALITQGYLPLAQTMQRISDDQLRIQRDVSRLLEGSQRPGRGAESASAIFTDDMSRNLEDARVRVRTAKRLATQPLEKATLTKIESQLDRVHTQFSTYQQLVRGIVRDGERGRTRAAEASETKLRRTRTVLREDVDAIARDVDRRIRELTLETETMRAQATAIAAVLAAIAIALAGALLLAVLYALAPINRLTAQVQRFAGGDYSSRVDVRGRDELAALATEFNAMAAAIEARDQALVDRAEDLDRLTTYLSSVLDSLQGGLFVLEGGRITLSNPSATDTWDATLDAPPPPSLDPVVSTLGRHELAGPDGTLHDVRVMPFGDQGRLVLTADITEQTRAKQRLARSERLALVGQMLAQITHEVRNPLNAMSLNAELLSDELSDLDPDRSTEAWDLLGTVSGEIDRLTRVTAHYLQLARRPRPTLAMVSVPGLVEDVIRLLEPELAQRGVGLSHTLAPLDAECVDGSQLRQALLNVIRNAMDADATALVVTLVRTAGETRLAVRDDGSGMDEEQIARATDPFFSTKASGTGLGLAITRQILEDHDGGLRIVSSGEHGTTVTLYWPTHLALPEPVP